MSKNAATLLMLAGLAALCACDGARSRDARDPSTPSGFAVPRWLVLKFDEVNARSGPSEENRVLWTYHSKGLPVQVVAETKEWRRICDPDGGLVWVKKGQVDGHRNVMRLKQTPLELRRGAKAEAGVAAILKARSIAEFGGCKDGWCKVTASGVTGWAQASELWGVAEEPLCRGGPRAPVSKPAP